MVNRQALDDESFKRSLRDAFCVQLICANTCSRLGAVEVRPAALRVRPSFDQRKEYRDDGDLDVVWCEGGRLWKYEVKWRRKLQFECASRFPYRTIFVDECYNLDMKNPKPDAYMICNADLTAAVVVPLTAPLTKVTHSDDRYNQPITSYEVDRGYAHTLALHRI